MDVRALAYRIMRLDISGSRRVLASVVAWSFLFERNRARQYDDTLLLVLRDAVLQNGAKELVLSYDRILQLSSRFVFILFMD